MIKKYLETGKVVGTHGVKGTVRVQPWSDSGDFLAGFEYFYLDNNGSEKLTAEKIQPHGNVVLITFKGVETIEQAETLRNKVLYIDRKDADLPEGRYFIDDLLGCEVFDSDTGVKYGVITDVSSTGANDVWHITSGGKEYLLPAIEEVLGEIDPINEKITVRPMKGIFGDED